MKHIGQGYTGLTNRQLVAGKGVFVADMQRPNMLYLAIVRSPYASARIRKIDFSAAQAVPGVVKIIDGKEVKANMNPIFEAYDTAAMGAKGVVCYALCPERVRYVGEAVAAVVAEDKYTARKAADLVEVDYEETPVVTDPEEAMKRGSPLVEPDWGDNLLMTRDFVKGVATRPESPLPVLRPVQGVHPPSRSPFCATLQHRCLNSLRQHHRQTPTAGATATCPSAIRVPTPRPDPMTRAQT